MKDELNGEINEVCWFEGENVFIENKERKN